jgi:hypothetical protein
MMTYPSTNSTSKAGVNFIRSVVEDAGSLFHKIDQENDLGIDALIEFVRNGNPLGKMVAIQIKSGQSYYNPKTQTCMIPIEKHRQYWLGYHLPVLGIVYVPTLQRAHWVEIKPYLKEYPTSTLIRFTASEANRFDSSTFEQLFLPMILLETVDMPFEQALDLFRSPNADESYLGLIILFRQHPDRREVWHHFISYFTKSPSARIPPELIYYLAHIPWHPDIAYFGEPISKETRDHARQLLAGFGRAEILKLLEFIDEENIISRGAIGQSVEAIISSLPNVDPILEDIARAADVRLFTRECAALILAMHLGRAAKPTLQLLADSGSWYARELSNFLEQYGWIDPYA